MEKSHSAPAAEARANERARDVLLVSFTIAASVAAEYTETYDIAVGGLAMLTTTQLKRDMDLLVELELRNSKRSKLQVDGSVRWSTFDPLLGKYRTGISFRGRSPQFERELLQYIDTLQELRDLGLR